MIPQIAHHPRHLSQQFGGPEFATPPFDSLQAPRLPDRLAPLPFRSPRIITPSSSLSQVHRAYPVESHVSYRVGLAATTPSGAFGGQYHDPSEHMLRRKTPNGTLAAGYDGTPVQWSSKGPPLKHVLLPMSAVSGQNGRDSTYTSDESRSRQRSNSVGWNYQPTTQFRNDGGSRINSDPGNWTYLQHGANTPSNVLDHLSMQQNTTYYPNNGIQVPTVLQPPYQASPGPTASNDGGLYGPYWPDGKFVPYRPAAVRDPGHHHLVQEFDLNHGYQQHSHSPAGLQPFRQASLNIDSMQHIGRPSFPSLDAGSHLLENGYNTPRHAPYFHDNSPLYLAIPDGSRTPTAQSPNSNTRFREKTLSWAHSIYVDLLAFLHQSKKENRHSRQAHGFRPYSKSSIYPKPPRQPSSTFGNTDWNGLYNSGHENDSVSPRSHAGNMSSNSHHSSNNFGGWQGNGDSGEQKFSRFSNQDMPHYVSPFQASHHSTSSPTGKAKEALEMLTTLCEQSGWCWIDGMLLGGCLAYGLEEYLKALEWYSKIIAIDPK